MKKIEENIVLKNSKLFAIRIIKLYKYLVNDKQEYVISKQILRSGANVRESVNAQSTMDFINKLNIALKEANETEYWLELLHETDYITEDQFNSMYQDCGENVALLTSIILTTKNKKIK